MQCPHCFKDDLDERATRCPHCTGRIRKTSVKAEASKLVNRAKPMAKSFASEVWGFFVMMVAAVVMFGMIGVGIVVMNEISLTLKNLGYEKCSLGFPIVILILGTICQIRYKTFERFVDSCFRLTFKTLRANDDHINYD